MLRRAGARVLRGEQLLGLATRRGGDRDHAHGFIRLRAHAHATRFLRHSRIFKARGPSVQATRLNSCACLPLMQLPAEGQPPRKPNSMRRVRSTDLVTDQHAPKEAPAADVTQLVLVSDPGQDLDDEMGFTMLRHLCDNQNVVLKGVIATLYPAFDRARLCRGTLDMLGMHSVPVGIGTDGGDTKGVHSARSFEVLASSYLPDPESESTASLEPGSKLLHSLWADAAPQSLTLVVIASLKDVALFLRDNETLFLEKTKEVVIMGGVQPPERADEVLCQSMIPDTAHNNQFDRSASEYFYRRCQDIGVPLIVVSRWSAYAVQMPRSTYDELALTGSSIGFRLRSAQRDSIEQLWQRACAPDGSDAREGLPDRCDRSWFLDTFCSGSDGIDAKTGHVRGGGDPVWDLVASFNQYDTIAILAAVPAMRAKFFEPLECKVAATATNARHAEGTTHLVIGVTKDSTGVREEGKGALLQLLRQGYVDGLRANLRIAKEQLVVVTGPRQLEHDIRLMCLTLRALYDLGKVTCLGVVVDDSSSAAAGDTGGEAEAERFSIREVLDELGLHHVKVLTTSAEGGQSADQHIADLYADALPSPVTLVVTSAATAAATFVGTSPELFRKRTGKLVIVGDAVQQQASAAEDTEAAVFRAVGSAQTSVDIEDGETRTGGSSGLADGRQTLAPDPKAANWCLDLVAAEQLFVMAQEQVRLRNHKQRR